jgi:uncharacterized membrane protein (UPF0127 family)
MLTPLVILAVYYLMIPPPWGHGGKLFSTGSVIYPQSKLPMIKLIVGRSPVLAEVAQTPKEMSAGLMGRSSLPPGTAMLFVFREPSGLGFWMKNTTVPLSIAFIDPGGLIQEIYDLEPLDESIIKSSSQKLLYALEVPRGWFEKNNITKGVGVSGLPPAPPALSQ